MKTYQHILAGLELADEAEGKAVLQRAAALRDACGARLSCTHVVEPLSLAYGGDIPMDLSAIQEQIQESARARMAELAEPLGIAEADQHLAFGRPESEIHTLAKALGADLIVVGSHGRHGLAVLFNSTADSVMHGASCDVLAVRVE